VSKFFTPINFATNGKKCAIDEVKNEILLPTRCQNPPTRLSVSGLCSGSRPQFTCSKQRKEGSKALPRVLNMGRVYKAILFLAFAQQNSPHEKHLALTWLGFTYFCGRLLNT